MTVHLWVEMYPPAPLNMTLWKWGLYKGNQLKMRSLGWPYTSLTHALVKRENLDAETDMLEEKRCEET